MIGNGLPWVRLGPNVWFFGADEGQVVNADQLTPNCGASDDFMAFFAATLNGLPFTCGDTIFGFGAYTFAIDAMDQAGNSAHLSASVKRIKGPSRRGKSEDAACAAAKKAVNEEVGRHGPAGSTYGLHAKCVCKKG